MGAIESRRPPSAGIGRKKGVPNKMTREVKEMILEALDKAGGVSYLAKRAVDTPGPFLALVGKILPLQVTGKDGAPVEVREVRHLHVASPSDPR